MQFTEPALLAPIRIAGKYFVVKELQPSMDKMDLTVCHGKIKKLVKIIDTMAQVTASAHLRSSGRQGSGTADELIAFGLQQDGLRAGLTEFSVHYYEKTKTYYGEFCKAFDEQYG